MAKTWFIAKPGFSIDGTLGGARNLKNLVSRVVERFPSDLNMAKPGFSGSFKTVQAAVRLALPRESLPLLNIEFASILPEKASPQIRPETSF